MSATVVNVKVAHLRPRYQNLQEWMREPRNIYIGRRGVVFIKGTRFPPKDSIWANPYKIGRDGTRTEVLKKYRKYIEQKFANGDIPYAELEKLRGCNLGCWCAPEPCHGDILVEILDAWATA